MNPSSKTPAQSYPEIGQKAPELGIPDQDGIEVRLADRAGKWLVVYFYPRDNTSGCTLEAQEFTALKNDFANLKAEILGISSDSQASHRRFRESKGISLQLLSDPEQVVQTRWGVWQKKQSYGREYLGTVRTTFLVDPKGKVAARWLKVRSRGHAQTVLDQLASMTEPVA